MKPATSRALLLAGALLFSVALCESGLRLLRNGTLVPLSGEHVLREPHPTRGWSLRPGKRALQRSLDYAVAVEINALGLRDRPRSYAPAEGVSRIVVLGDSFMEAYQVDFEDALPARLERALHDRSVEVINLGVGGYGTAQQLIQLREEGLRYQPDLVILAFFVGNDVQNNSRTLERERWGADSAKTFGRPYALAEGPRSGLAWTAPDFERMRRDSNAANQRRASALRRLRDWITPSLLANTIARAAAAVGASPADAKRDFALPFLARSESPAWDAAWTVTLRLLLEMRDTTRRAGAEFVILLVPAKLQVDPEFRSRVAALHADAAFDEMRINRALEAFARENGIQLVDPTPAFVRASASGERLFHQYEDHHWNARGHEVATRELEAFLEESGLLPGQAAGGGGSSNAR